MTEGAAAVFALDFLTAEAADRFAADICSNSLFGMLATSGTRFFAALMILFPDFQNIQRNFLNYQLHRII